MTKFRRMAKILEFVESIEQKELERPFMVRQEVIEFDGFSRACSLIKQFIKETTDTIWVDCNEKLPSIGDECWLFTVNHEYACGWWGGKYFDSIEDSFLKPIDDITHWALCEPPQEKNNINEKKT